jgi:hypothetical protein
MKQRCSAAFVGFGALTPSLRQVVPSRLLIVAADVLGHVFAFRSKSDELVGGIHGLVAPHAPAYCRAIAALAAALRSSSVSWSIWAETSALTLKTVPVMTNGSHRWQEAMTLDPSGILSFGPKWHHDDR